MKVQLGSIARFSSILIALAITSASGAAQASTNVGTRIGYNFDIKNAVLGAHMTVPITTRIEFYPSIDLYLPTEGNMMGFNGDVKLVHQLPSGPIVYGGGGVGLVNRNIANVSNTDIGINLLFGVESRVSRIHPFGELRILLHDETSLTLLAGVNFALGSR